MKAKFVGAAGAVWFFAVVLPINALFEVLRFATVGVFDSFTGRGFKPRNDLVDEVYGQCVNLPANEGVRLPWVNTDQKQTRVLMASDRLYAYVAMANGWFGLAEKVTGKGANQKRTYRYYYRRSMAGNWFAEVWSVWRSAFWATILAVPFVGWMLNPHRMEGSSEYGLILLVAGLLLIVFFLPRAILGRGVHLTTISLVNVAGGGYGCAQIINWVAGLAGISYVWVAFGLEWDLAASLGIWHDDSVQGTVEGLYGVAIICGLLVGMILFGMAMVLLPAAFFWYVAMIYHANRVAAAQLRALPFNKIQAGMFEGSAFQEQSSFTAPQIAFGGLLYVLACAFVLGPVLISVIEFFSG